MGNRKVLYIFNSANYSGAEIVMARLILSNLKSVFPIIICPPGNLSDTFKSFGIITIECLSLSGLNRSKKQYTFINKLFKITNNTISINLTILNILIKYRIKIIHANNLASSVYAIPSLIISKCFLPSNKWIWSNHDINYLIDKEIGNRLVKWLVKLYDMTIAVSVAVKNKIDPLSTNNKIFVLYNGVNLSEFSQDNFHRIQTRDYLGIPQDCIVISIIGTISEYKGHDLIINVFKRLQELFKNKIYLLIVGRSEDENFLDLLKKSVAKTESIKFLDHTNNILELYNCIDILVNATKSYRSEPLGTTIIEAMAFQKLVLASNTGGSPEIIDDTKNGYLFDADNENSLMSKLDYVINNFQNLDHIRQNARKKIHSTFEIQLMTQNYNNLLTK